MRKKTKTKTYMWLTIRTWSKESHWMAIKTNFLKWTNQIGEAHCCVGDNSMG